MASGRRNDEPCDRGNCSADACILTFGSDILHPSRPNISKDELRDKLAGMYKAQKDQVSVFGLRTQFGGGKTTGCALVYDSPEAMKKFEPHYRLVRVGLASKIERASRQQRTSNTLGAFCLERQRDRADIPFSTLQASSARTGRRLCGERQRSRVPKRRRRNKRLALLFASSFTPGFGGGLDNGCGSVHYPSTDATCIRQHPENRDDLTQYWGFIKEGVTVGLRVFLAAHSIRNTRVSGVACHSGGA